MLDLYRNIKQKRIQMGWSQTTLAEKAGYSDKSMIAKIENGKVDLPQSKIRKFAEIFHCTEVELMGWSEPQKTIDYMIKSKDDFEVPIEIKKEIKKLNEKQIVLLIAFLKMLNEQN